MNLGELKAMTAGDLVFWHSNAQDFYRESKGAPAAGSTIVTWHTRMIENYVAQLTRETA